jgi:dTDP-glucose 4,6-dehydratase
MCITKCLKGDKLTIQGTGEYVRNWIYVKDNCEAIMKVLEMGKDGESYHISSDEELSVLEIAKKVLDAFGKPWDENVEFVQNRSGQDVRYALDNMKIKYELNWKVGNRMDDVLQKMIESYR